MKRLFCKPSYTSLLIFYEFSQRVFDSFPALLHIFALLYPTLRTVSKEIDLAEKSVLS